jgi:hypothetical protein
MKRSESFALLVQEALRTNVVPVPVDAMGCLACALSVPKRLLRKTLARNFIVAYVCAQDGDLDGLDQLLSRRLLKRMRRWLRDHDDRMCLPSAQ